MRGAGSALALVPGALEQLALLVLAHLLAPLLDHAAHGESSRLNLEKRGRNNQRHAGSQLGEERSLRRGAPPAVR